MSRTLVLCLGLFLSTCTASAPVLARWKVEYSSASAEVIDWYQNAKLTEAAQKRFNFKSCCAKSDVVHTQFHVNKDSREDEWFYQDKLGHWRQIPPDIIHWGESAPNGQPTLFLLGGVGEPTRFFPGESGG